MKGDKIRLKNIGKIDITIEALERISINNSLSFKDSQLVKDVKNIMEKIEEASKENSSAILVLENE